MGLIDALLNLGKKDADPATSQQGAEEINKALPRQMSGRDAVMRKRDQLRRLDEDTESDEARSARLKAQALRGS